VPKEEVFLESSAAAAPPHEPLLGEGGNAAAAAGAGAPALCIPPVPTLPFGCDDRGGKSWVESVFCEGTVTAGEISPLPARRLGSNALGASRLLRDSRNAVGR